MKTTIFYTVTFLAYVKIYFICQLLLIDSKARFLNCKVLILDLKQFLISVSFEKLF